HRLEPLPRGLELDEVSELHVAVDEIHLGAGEPQLVAARLEVAWVAESDAHAATLEVALQLRHLGDASGPVTVLQNANAQRRGDRQALRLRRHEVGDDVAAVLERCY